MDDRHDVSHLSLDDISRDFVQIHQDIHARSVIALGTSIAVAVGVLAVLGRLVFSYSPSVSFWGYIGMFVFSIPMLLTYSERIEAIGAPGGLYGLVRQRYGIALGFVVGWLELAGYATVIAILARTVVIYGLTIYTALGGNADLSVMWMTIGVVILMFIFKLTGWHSSRKINTALVFSGLLMIAGLAVYSLFNDRQDFRMLTSALQTIKPLKLSALLFSSFWGVIMIFGIRQRVIRRNKGSMISLNAMILLIMAIIGATLSFTVIPSTFAREGQNFLSVNTYSAIVFLGNHVFTGLIALFSIFLAIIGLERSLQGSVETMTLMTNDAYFPSRFNFRLRKKHVLAPLVIVAALSIVLTYFLETMVIVGMAAAFLLWVTILIHIPDIPSHRPKLPENRLLKLPYHPLFPAVTVLVATIITVNLKYEVLQWSALWLIAGLVILSTYSYRRALTKRGEKRTFGDEEALVGETTVRTVLPEGPIVLSLVRKTEDVENMVQLGGRIAKGMNAMLVLMQITEVPDSMTERERQKLGETLWRELSTKIQDSGITFDGLTIRPMVRLTHKLIRGVINAAQEVHPQVMLLPPDFTADDPVENIEDYDSILRQAPGNIIFLNQFPPLDDLHHISVLVGAGGQAASTLLLAKTLLADDGQIEVLHILDETETPAESADAARQRIETLLQANEIDLNRVKINILHMTSLEEVVEELVDDTDLLLLGAAKNFMSRRATFGGVNAHVFQSSEVPIMLVRVYEKIRFAWASQLWETLTRPLPKLTIVEREEVAADILAGAHPSIDFFVLILLSSGIALYGLLQNSGAVIIGAMLVAPLMSPIIAMGMAMVRGDLKTLGTAAQTTAQGVLLAISVGAVLTFLSPIRGTTDQILSRVSPNLLDLGIAFLSGAAGGYAVTRKSIAAALPGVAIAAALVPPLAVVGFGFATADLSIATGALLLFLTNLIAIVLAASLVFLALDFLSPEKQTWREVMRGLKVTAVFLVLVVLILGFVTYRTVAQQQKKQAIEAVLNQGLYSKSFEPLEIQISGNRNGYLIKGKLLSFDQPLTSKELERLGKELEAAVGAPVSLDIKSIPAHESSVDFETAVTVSEIEETVRKELSDLPIDIIDIEAESLPMGYSVFLVVVEYDKNVLTQEELNDLEQTLVEKYNSDFKITAYSIPVEKLEVEPTQTPTPQSSPQPTPTS